MSLSYQPAFCVLCGHADSALIADRDSLQSEVELLWAYHERRLAPDTPPQHLMDRVAFSEHPPLHLVRCRECGLVYRNPVERAHELTEIYAGEAPAPDVLRALHDTQLPALRVQALRLRRVLGRGGSGLEVGSYVGAFLAAAANEGLQVEGLDINRDVNAFTRSLGFAVHDGTLETFAAGRTFDTVAIWNTFDQLAEPRAAVLAARRLLRPGGLLALRVPNGAFYAALRPRLWHPLPAVRSAARALLAQNNLLTFPYRTGFTVGALTRLLDEGGFRAVHVRGDVLVPIADEWTRRWARWEEAGIKRLLGAWVERRPTRAPWIEMYAVTE